MSELRFVVQRCIWLCDKMESKYPQGYTNIKNWSHTAMFIAMKVCGQRNNIFIAGEIHTFIHKKQTPFEFAPIRALYASWCRWLCHGPLWCWKNIIHIIIDNSEGLTTRSVSWLLIPWLNALKDWLLHCIYRHRSCYRGRSQKTCTWWPYQMETSFALLGLCVRGIHRSPVNSLHRGQ